MYCLDEDRVALFKPEQARSYHRSVLKIEWSLALFPQRRLDKTPLRLWRGVAADVGEAELARRIGRYHLTRYDVSSHKCPPQDLMPPDHSVAGLLRQTNIARSTYSTCCDLIDHSTWAT